MSEVEQPGGEESVDWVRGPRIADVTDVSPHKLEKAFRERGIEVEPVSPGIPGRKIVRVTKTVAAGMPAARKPLWKRLFGID